MEIALASLGCSHNQNIQYTGIAEYFFTSVKNDCIAPPCDHPRAVVSRAQCTVRTFHLSQLPELCLGPPDPWGFARLLGFPGFRSPPGIPREQPLPYGAYNRTLTALCSAITAIFGLISDCARDLFILTAAARPRRDCHLHAN